MNDMTTKLAEVVGEMRRNGIVIPENVDRALEELSDPVYRVGIVGRFQTGKSKLINEVFLGENLLLQEGAGLCTTAVTTEIASGEKSQLTVNYKDGRPSRVVLNPDADDIRKVTSSDDGAVRRQLAAEVDTVRLELPCESLRKFMVYDTAGIDDPDPELLQLTTYRTIPSLDVAVMVVGAKALSQAEMNFLRRGVFQCGIAQVMVLVSYNAATGGLSELGRAELLESIRGQLAEIGRGDVPVKMVCYDASVTDVLCTREAIRNEVTAFAESSAVQNRLAKLSVQVRKILSDRIRSLRFRLSLADKTAEDVAKTQRDLALLEAELKGTRGELQDRFDGMLTQIAQEEGVRFRGACDEIVGAFLAKVDVAADLGEAQDRLKSVGADVVPQVESAAIASFDRIRGRVKDELAKINARLVVICADCKLPSLLFDSSVAVDGGFCESLNSKAVTVVDYIVSMIVLPGGLIMSWAIRYCLGMIPVVKRLMPLALVTAHFARQVRTSLTDEKDRLVESFRTNVESALRALRTEIFKALYDEVDARIREAAEAAALKTEGLSRTDKERFQQEVAGCERLLASL